jgi:hypothetical protein
VNVVPLKYGLNSRPGHIRFIRRVPAPAAQPLKRCGLVAERFQECVRELSRIKWILDQLADCFFDLDRVQPFAPSIG